LELVDIIGFVAAVFTTSSTLPQLFKIIKTKHAGDVSIIMFIMTFIGLSLWLVYGIITGSNPIIVANTFSLVFIALTIYYKLRYS
jgi:MtN3 and saliva related transmembrane protein